MTALQDILAAYRQTARTEREKGAYFEHLVKAYLLHEPSYQDLFGGKVFLWEEWRQRLLSQGHADPGPDAGIDLVAVEAVEDSPRIFAIQAKFYDEDAKLSKGAGIDSFLSAMGKQPFTDGILFATTTQASAHVANLMAGRDKPVITVSLADLEHSQIDWRRFKPSAAPVLRKKKQPLPHQVNAISAVTQGLAKADRGKLIMACGTGKTFVSLRIAEDIAEKGGRVLFLVPSLALLSQALTEYTQESRIPLHNFAVCSDSDVGKKKRGGEDDVQMLKHELRFPATTNATRLAAEMKKRHDGEHLSVVYSTYHSINVISEAQKKHGLGEFDVIICDEAHRTTGSKWEGEEESHFVRVHDGAFIKARKRLYMTATPRIYGPSAKAKEEQGGVELYSMDDAKLYGKQLHAVTFSEAVNRGLLCDYKVIVLSISADHVSRRLQGILRDDNNSLKVDDAGRIIGCWKALSKLDMKEEVEDDSDPMRRAVAFCQVIEISRGGKTHKVSSKQIAGMFDQVVRKYQEAELEEGRDHGTLACEAAHVDGTMNAGQKEEKLNWLKAQTPAGTCRILSNVRCLSEGVDVPALDAVLFLSPRNSQVEVVQSVGRVMRTAPGKERGYVILPVVIPEGMEPHEALNDNKTYKVVWEVLQALRSHDDRFDAHINKLDLIGADHAKMEVIAIVDDIRKGHESDAKREQTAHGRHAIGEDPAEYKPDQKEIPIIVGELERAMYAKIVKKCGNRSHWVEWAGDIAKIAQTHIARIRAIVSDKRNAKEAKAFTAFADELRDDLNDSITNDEVIEMLAQHLITKPVFDALFEGYGFARKNPVSRAMQQALDALYDHRLDKEADTLQQFYDSVKMRAEGIDNPAGKQKIVVELYDKFFRNAFPKMTERLGIVYTPVEVVDFIIHSVNHLLREEFGQTLGSKGVHIVDPFTGTGTFITRLLQSDLITRNQLEHKYRHEIHANEIVLLAYYIAAINIEAAYHAALGIDAVGEGEYEPFGGICLTDTFQLYEKDDLVSRLLADNSGRRKRQKELDIRVIMSNPPYSIGQRSQNDSNRNTAYPRLDGKIQDTYAARSSATLSRGLYDSYIRAIRWASDRIGESGIIGFVTNAGFLDTNSADGLRKCLADEFSSIFVFDLRGAIRGKSGDAAKKEGGNIFDIMTGVAITLLVKNPHVEMRGGGGARIYMHDIGEYISREEKIGQIFRNASVSNITGADDWRLVAPDIHGDWINQRDDSFHGHVVLGDRKGSGLKLFSDFSLGVGTNRDAWCYNHSSNAVAGNMKQMIAFYNSEVARFNKDYAESETKSRESKVDAFISTDPSKVSWSVNLKKCLAKDMKFKFHAGAITKSLYRPFVRQHLYFNRDLNERVLQMPRIFPDGDRTENCVIMTTAKGAQAFSCLISDVIPDLNTMAAGAQCFPLYLYDTGGAAASGNADDLFAAKSARAADGRARKDGITDEGLRHFQEAYPEETLSKEDVFYYIYGILHSEDYRARFAANLVKELPRIPRVKTAQDFRRFEKAGRALADLHLNYETVKPYPATLDTGKRKLADLKAADFRVTKMKHPKSPNEEGKKVNDLTTVIYNHGITVRDIPPKAYDYVVNGKPAIEWVIDRQCVKTDKASGIINDANHWAVETMKNPKYPLELLLRVITVSLETMKIVKGLPKLDI